MLSKKMEKALNEQLNAEAYSSYLYLSMSASFSARTLKGFAQWMSVQAKEEFAHAMKFYDYLIARGARVTLQGVAQPPADWAGPAAAFKDTLAHEQKVTAMIDKLADLAVAEKDHATREFLDWFVKEQVEEETQANDIVQRLNLAGSSTGALLFLDHELGKRGK